MQRRRGIVTERRPVTARASSRALHEPLDDFDTTAEVDATFRTQRRVALGYFGVFLAVILAVPTLTLVLGWWSEGRIAGMSPNFLMAAGGLYLVFFAVALAASSLADAIEDRMLGGGDEHLEALPDVLPDLDVLPGSNRPNGSSGSSGPEGDPLPQPPDQGA